MQARTLRHLIGSGSPPGFDPEHHTVDAQILKFVMANYGLHWQRDRDPYRWERGGGDAKLDALFAVHIPSTFQNGSRSID